MFDSPRLRGRLHCYARIDGKHAWLYVGGDTARCEGCGGERSASSVTRASGLVPVPEPKEQT